MPAVHDTTEHKPVTPLINLRSERELRLMRAAGLVNWEAHQAAARLIKPGVNLLEIDAAVEEVFAKHGATPLFKGCPGVVPFPAATCLSVNEEIVHGIPKDRVLVEGDIVGVDTGCRVNGWCADSAVTYAVGPVSDRAAKLLEVTAATLDLAIELMKTKTRWSEIAAEMARLVRSAGFSVVEAMSGHGVGREMHEPPRVPNFYDPKSFKPIEDFRLRPGLVIAIEPMVNVGGKEVELLDDHWTIVTADRQPSAQFEHTVALTKNGPVRLTGGPEEAPI
jgi:methionyl aminopeptidase